MAKKTLILTASEIRRLISMPDVLKAVEKAFALHARGRTCMPPKIYLHLDKYGGDFRAMPAYIGGIEAAGLKWVNVHPHNRRLGLPAVMAVIILSDPANGFPLCIMDGTIITNLRTGAAGGVAAKYLARRDSSIIGMVGCGAQAKSQLMALKGLFRIKLVRIWGKDAGCVKQFMAKTRSFGLKIEACRDIAGCVRAADIVVTTTPSRKPLVKSSWIGKGTHINAIGADAKGKEELDPALLKRAKIVVDDPRQAVHSGEINVPITKGILKEKDIYASLGEVLIGRKKGRVRGDEITVFDSTGLAIQDVAVADLVYKKALRYKIGRWVSLLA